MQEMHHCSQSCSFKLTKNKNKLRLKSLTQDLQPEIIPLIRWNRIVKALKNLRIYESNEIRSVDTFQHEVRKMTFEVFFFTFLYQTLNVPLKLANNTARILAKSHKSESYLTIFLNIKLSFKKSFSGSVVLWNRQTIEQVRVSSLFLTDKYQW